MDFIMPVCKKIMTNKHSISYGFFILLGLFLLPTAGADFTVVKPGSILTEKTIELSGQLNLDLSSRVEEALGKGIPLEIAIEFRLYRQRDIIWDALIANWSFSHSIQYHALSRQYLVRGHGADADSVESFTTLQESLNYMGALDGLVLPLPQELVAPGPGANEYQYNGRIRAQLAIESLPAPLRPVAYTSTDWRLNTGWVTWKVPR
jgi:hypothetical protein